MSGRKSRFITKRSDRRIRKQMGGCGLLLCLGLFAACAGTAVVQKSIEHDVNEATGKVYQSKFELTRGRAGAALAKLDTGALTTYVQVDADGSYIIDMTGDASGVNAAALTDLANAFAEMLPGGQLVDFVAVLKSGASSEEIGTALTDALNSR